MKKWPVLSVAHTVWLTREQRYALQKNEPVEVIGTSLPVWFHKGNTSEPAQELFCKYTVTTTEPHAYIQHRLEGYEINVPLSVMPPDVPQEFWDELSEQDKEDFLRMNPSPGGAKDLADPPDGIKWFFFRQYTKVEKHDQTFIHLIHYIELRDIESLVETIS